MSDAIETVPLEQVSNTIQEPHVVSNNNLPQRLPKETSSHQSRRIVWQNIRLKTEKMMQTSASQVFHASYYSENNISV